MSDTLLLGTHKGFFAAAREADGWRIRHRAFLGDQVTVVLQDPRDGAIYAALKHGHFGAKLHRSRDGGASWQEVATPAYPPMPAGESDLNPASGEPVPWKLERVWALAAGHASEPGVLWCGTIPGGLFRSADHGDSWQLVEALWNHPSRRQWFGGGADLPGLHSVCVDPADGRHLLVGVSCGGVWETRDGGASWEVRAEGMFAAYMPPERKFDPIIQDPHCVVQCPAQPSHLWTQHHNGVFRSTDGARSWQEVPAAQPSVFGFAVAVHPTDPDTAWFVPATSDEHRVPVDGKVVVSRTRDGGKSFEVLRQGLPQDDAYDLTFRHGLDVDATGNRLAFGSTTGSVWISEDQGDTWSALSHHLPPIYAVRFAKA